MRAADSRVAVGGTLGLNVLGVEVQGRVLTRTDLVARVEGLPIARRRVVAAGLQFAPLESASARLALRGLVGAIRCMKLPFESNGCGEGDSWRRALGGFMEVEIPLDTAGRWAGGVEAGYWRAAGSDNLSRRLRHLDLNVTFRRYF